MELKYKNMNFIVGQLFGMDFENCYHDMVIVYKDNGVEEQYEYVGYFWGSNIDKETTKEYTIETIEKWLEQKQLNKTLYDLFVEKESFVFAWGDVCFWSFFEVCNNIIFFWND